MDHDRDSREHSDIIKMMGAVQMSQTKTLESIENLNRNMEKMLTQTRAEAEKNYEDHKTEIRDVYRKIEDIHERVTEVEVSGTATKKDAEGAVKALWMIGTATVISLMGSIFMVIRGFGAG